MFKNRAYAAVLALVMAFGTLSLFAAKPAHAGKEDTYKIATFVLGAGTVYALTKKKTTLGLVGAAGTYLAYKKWQDEKKESRGGGRRARRR